MSNFGFVKVAAATPSVNVADCKYNTSQIEELMGTAAKSGVEIVVFPEMSITAYTCGDLFHQQTLLNEAKRSLSQLLKTSENLEIITLVGMPLVLNNQLYNVAVVFSKGKIHGIVPKTYIPNYSEYYEKRWFASSLDLTSKEIVICGQNVQIGTNLIFETPSCKFAVEICEDLWTAVPPSSSHSLHGADIIFNLSASPEAVGKNNYRRDLVVQQSARCIAGYVYASAGNGESTTDLVFSGSSFIAENGALLSEGQRFSFNNNLICADIDVERLQTNRLKNTSFYTNPTSKDYNHILINLSKESLKFDLQRKINPTPFIPSDDSLNESCFDIFSIQVGGLAKRMLHTNSQSAVIGISGGLDSTLALLALVKTFDKLNIPRSNIVGITMPGFGTTDRTYNNAITLMKSLGVTVKEISIVPAVEQHFKDIKHDASLLDITYENSQARERTQILMDYANKVNGLVIGTGNMSESALGWATYNGDHMSMYAINSGIPKTLVKVLVGWVAENEMDEHPAKILEDVISTPFSPELLPADENGKIQQITEDNVGPYILHDFFLYYLLRFGFSPSKIHFLAAHAFEGTFNNDEILKWLKKFYWRFFSQQFKRSCMPDGPKVGSINLSPRGDWRMPSDAKVQIWIDELESIK